MLAEPGTPGVTPCDRLGVDLVTVGTGATTDSGTPLGQCIGVGCGLAGPGSDFSEESAVGAGPAVLDVRVAPACPPGSASFVVVASAMS
jgi:hypothetical protein